MNVNIDTLTDLIMLLLSNLKESKGNEIELKNDYYWDISKDQLYDPYKDPTEMSLAQLSDDWIELNRLVKSKEIAIPYDLKRIAEILKALGIENDSAF